MSLSAPTISIIGPEECGKSTLIGFFMYSLFKKAMAQQNNEMEAAKPSQEHTKVVFDDWWEKAIRVIESGPWRKSEARFAYLVDTFDHERNRDNVNKTTTKDLNFIQLKMGGNNHPLTLVNVPGHFKFWTKIVSASSISDYVILMVDAKKYQKDYSIPQSDEIKGMKDGNYKEFPRGIIYSTLAAFITYSKIFVLISKMDLDGFNEKRYTEVCDHVADQLEALGLSKNKLTFLPIAIDRANAIGHNILKGEKGDFQFTETEIMSFQECLENIQHTEMPLGADDKLIMDVIPKSEHHSQIVVRLRSGILKNAMEVRCFPLDNDVEPFIGRVAAVWEPYRTAREFSEANKIDRPENYPPGSIFAVKIKGLSDSLRLQAITELTLDLKKDYILAKNVKCFVLTSMLCDEIKEGDRQPVDIVSRGYYGKALVKKVRRLGAVYDLPQILRASRNYLEDENDDSERILRYYDVGIIDLELQGGAMFISLSVAKIREALEENRGNMPIFSEISAEYGVLPFSITSLDQYSVGAIGRLIHAQG